MNLVHVMIICVFWSGKSKEIWVHFLMLLVYGIDSMKNIKEHGFVCVYVMNVRDFLNFKMTIVICN
jgi:hypothetical protein